MEYTLGCSAIVALAWTVSFYAARACLYGVLCMIHHSVPRPALRRPGDGN
jgi:hypothetical protein